MSTALPIESLAAPTEITYRIYRHQDESSNWFIVAERNERRVIVLQHCSSLEKAEQARRRLMGARRETQHEWDALRKRVVQRIEQREVAK